MWTTRLLARHAREHGPAEGHACLGKLVQGTLCKILNEQEVKPHKVRYYLERRDPEFKAKMAEVLCVYREVKIVRRYFRPAAYRCDPELPRRICALAAESGKASNVWAPTLQRTAVKSTAVKAPTNL